MLMPGRHYNADKYRFGFQGQEKDDEIKGVGNSINYKFRMHDPRVGRFFAIDPLTADYPFYSPYQFSGNRVIDMVELEGAEPIWHESKNGDTKSSIAEQYGVSEEDLDKYNPDSDYSAGSKIYLSDPNSWNYVDDIEKWLNNGAQMNYKDLTAHPANYWGSKEAAGILSSLQKKYITNNDDNSLNRFSEFGENWYKYNNYAFTLGFPSPQNAINEKITEFNHLCDYIDKWEDRGMYVIGALEAGYAGISGIRSLSRMSIFGANRRWGYTFNNRILGLKIPEEATIQLLYRNPSAGGGTLFAYNSPTKIYRLDFHGIYLQSTRMRMQLLHYHNASRANFVSNRQFMKEARLHKIWFGKTFILK